MNKKSITDLEVQGKRVLVRVDYNVPMNDKGEITDDTRIRATLPTIRYLLEKGAAVVLMSHLGRPKGKPVAEFSLQPVAKRLAELLKQTVEFVPECIGGQAQEKSQNLKPGQVLLLENLRFHPEEEKNDENFSRQLAAHGELAVNDAFGVSHRAHASVEGITRFLPMAAGFLMEKEIRFVGNAVAHPQAPFVAIIGGAKVSDKIGVIDNLLTKVNTLIVGGGMANTFLAAQGYNMGASLVEADKIDLAKSLLAKAKEKQVSFLLPQDVVAAEKFDPAAAHKVVAVDAIPAGWMALDIGPTSRKNFAQALQTAKTVVWNGPMGVFEMDAFAEGTKAVAQAVADSAATSIVGGGDSIAALEKTGLADKITHISTGGGASLEYLEGKILPGIAAISRLRRPVIAGNWKMHKTAQEAQALVSDLAKLERKSQETEVVICPTFTALAAVADMARTAEIGLGAQNMHWEVKGAFTGEISADMLLAAGCTHVIIGHSERRQYFAETDQTVNAKIKTALSKKLVPIVCVGESLEQREQGITETFVGAQVEAALQGLSADQTASLIIAYEPIWAIGTGKTASSADANAVCAFIRATVCKLFDEKTAARIRIQYGGSVKAETIAELMNQNDVDGALVGGASLEPESFGRIINF